MEQAFLPIMMQNLAKPASRSMDNFVNMLSKLPLKPQPADFINIQRESDKKLYPHP